MRAEDTAKGVKEMAKLMGKGGTLAKNYIGGQIRKIGEVAKVTIIPRPDKIPTLIIGQKGSGGPWPHVSCSLFYYDYC